MNVSYKIIDKTNFNQNVLDNFNRYQKTKKILKINNNSTIVKKNFFVDDWDDYEKEQVISSLRNSINNKGIIIGAFNEDMVIGFLCIEGDFFGKNKEYLELNYIHVSYEHRGKGIGKKLFKLGCDLAKQRGAKKLYIGAHPAIETQAFYKSVGCVIAKEINKQIYRREPRDLQLEYEIK